jgi:hypothetical protein
MSLHANVINIIELIENVCQDQSMSFSPLTPVSATKLLAVKARAHKVQIHHMHVQTVHTCQSASGAVELLGGRVWKSQASDFLMLSWGFAFAQGKSVPIAGHPIPGISATSSMEHSEPLPTCWNYTPLDPKHLKHIHSSKRATVEMHLEACSL